MPPIFSKLRFVNKRSKTITMGYIRSVENELHTNHHNVPIGIKNLCVLYYLETEQFGRHSKELMISSSNGREKNDIVEQMEDGYWYCVYGTIIIDKKKHPDSIYKWKLRLNKSNKECVLPSIGIVVVNDNTKLPLDYYCFVIASGQSYPCEYYGFELTWGSIRSKEIDDQIGDCLYHSLKNDINEGDIIKMELNIKNKTLKYYLNDKDLGIAFKNINMNYKYCLAISFASKGIQIQIVDFQNETHK
eukprot:554589_1